MKKVFLDTNILLDYIQFREPGGIAAEQVFDACVQGEAECYIAAHSLLNVFYILRKNYTSQERALMVETFLSMCETVPINDENLYKALDDERFNDPEDALQMICAESVGADVFITRDLNGFAGSTIPIASSI